MLIDHYTKLSFFLATRFSFRFSFLCVCQEDGCVIHFIILLLQSINDQLYKNIILTDLPVIHSNIIQPNQMLG